MLTVNTFASKAQIQLPLFSYKLRLVSMGLFSLQRAGCRDLPQIIDYMKVKAEIGDLEKKLTDWGRKIEIAEMDQARTRKIHLAMTALPVTATQGL